MKYGTGANPGLDELLSDWMILEKSAGSSLRLVLNSGSTKRRSFPFLMRMKIQKRTPREIKATELVTTIAAKRPAGIDLALDEH
jgi:hypothetical protein